MTKPGKGQVFDNALQGGATAFCWILLPESLLPKLSKQTSGQLAISIGSLFIIYMMVYVAFWIFRSRRS